MALIESDVASGELGEGERLPSVREMADAVSLAPNTVAVAYRRLADRGVVESRGRAGTFVHERPSVGVHRAPLVPQGAVDLASGDPDPRLLPDLGPYLLQSGPSTLYTDAPVVPALVRIGSEWLASQGVVPRRMTVTSGALDAIERVLAAHLRPGDTVALERPGWVAVADLVRALGLRVVPVDVDDRGMLPGRLAGVVAGIDALVVTPRAQNPCGSAVDAERRAELVSVLDECPEVLVIEDDHAGPVAGAPLHPVGPVRRRWAFVQSVAKVLGPDLRLALLTGDDLTIDRVAGRFAIGPGWVSRILQTAVAAMLEDGAVMDLLAQAEQSYATRRRDLLARLGEAGVGGATAPSGLNVWVPVPSESSALSSASAAGFVVRAGSPFGGGPAVRVTVSNLDVPMIRPLVDALVQPASVRGRLV